MCTKKTRFVFLKEFADRRNSKKGTKIFFKKLIHSMFLMKPLIFFFLIINIFEQQCSQKLFKLEFLKNKIFLKIFYVPVKQKKTRKFQI